MTGKARGKEEEEEGLKEEDVLENDIDNHFGDPR